MKELCLDSLEETEPDCAVPLDVHVTLPPDENGCNYIRRKRYRTPNEIYRDLHREMNKTVCKCGHEWESVTSNFDRPCEKCGRGFDDRFSLIDEYDSCCHFGDDEDIEIADREFNICKIAVYCEVGSNEGYSVYATVHFNNWSNHETKTVDVYRIKSFAGMDHCHMLVKRIMKLMGVWPNYGRDKE